MKRFIIFSLLILFSASAFASCLTNTDFESGTSGWTQNVYGDAFDTSFSVITPGHLGTHSAKIVTEGYSGHYVGGQTVSQQLTCPISEFCVYAKWISNEGYNDAYLRIGSMVLYNVSTQRIDSSYAQYCFTNGGAGFASGDIVYFGADVWSSGGDSSGQIYFDDITYTEATTTTTAATTTTTAATTTTTAATTTTTEATTTTSTTEATTTSSTTTTLYSPPGTHGVNEIYAVMFPVFAFLTMLSIFIYTEEDIVRIVKPLISATLWFISGYFTVSIRHIGDFTTIMSPYYIDSGNGLVGQIFIALSLFFFAYSIVIIASVLLESADSGEGKDGQRI